MLKFRYKLYDTVKIHMDWISVYSVKINFKITNFKKLKFFTKFFKMKFTNFKKLKKEILNIK